MRYPVYTWFLFPLQTEAVKLFRVRRLTQNQSSGQDAYVHLTYLARLTASHVYHRLHDAGAIIAVEVVEQEATARLT